MKLILISPPDYNPGEEKLVQKFFEHGLEIFHVRKDTEEIESVSDYISRIPEAYHHKLMLHRHHELAGSFNIKGLHFNRHRPFREADYGPLALSASVHEFEEVTALEDKLDYMFISPVFESYSKPGYLPSRKLEAYADFMIQYGGKAGIMALGGITSANAEFVKHAGFDGLAVLGTIWDRWKQRGPAAAMTEFEKLQVLMQD